MGLDQEILRGSHNLTPKINQTTGEWIGAQKLIDFRKAYWLHNVMIKTGMVKLNKSVDDLNTICIPLTREELLDIFEKTKECVKTGSSTLIYDYFEVNINEHDYRFDWVLDEMKYFNSVMSRFLKNKKKTEYYYWSWW